MLNLLLESAKQKINDAINITEINCLRVEFLGKNGHITGQMKKLSSLSTEERKEFGLKINNIKQEIEDLITRRTRILADLDMDKKLSLERLDLTLPARIKPQGSIHPITQCTNELIEIFSQFGFAIKEGPSIETDWYNFTALNIDENHPARQMHDTFYLNIKGNNNVLRTHTSPTQIRVMQNETPPLRIISPGRTYRSDSDITHTPMFHQIEGFVIDKDINMGHLKHTIIEFIKAFFEQPKVEIRFRPSFFPFTEPSAEVDIRMNSTDKWLEVLGCGMIHPKVLQNGNINPDEYSAFAFGLGIERFAMLKYGIKDLRQFFEGDLRWIKHYNFNAFDIPSFTGGLTK